MEVIGLPERFVVSLRRRAHGCGFRCQLLQLVRSVGAVFLRLLALAEVALFAPDGGRGRGVLRLAPEGSAVNLVKGEQRPIEAGEIEMIVGEHRRSDDLAVDVLPPKFRAVGQIEAAQHMAMLFIREGNEDAAVVCGGNIQDRIAEPLFPHGLTGKGQHLQFTALGVEYDPILDDDGGGRPVVIGLILPADSAGVRVESEEFVTAKTAAQEYGGIGDSRRGERWLARDTDFPSFDASVRAGERFGAATSDNLPFRLGSIFMFVLQETPVFLETVG